MLKIYKSRKNFHKLFVVERDKLREILGNVCVIEHVGSTAVAGLDGKGIIDILIGFENEKQIDKSIKKLLDNGYFSARNNSGRKDYVFMASSEDDTTLGDFHLHLTMQDSKDFNNFIKVRDFLSNNPKDAKKYSDLKYKIAKSTGYDREEYKKQKSEFINNIIKRVNS